MSLRVHVDRPACIGAGNCVAIAPTAFDWLEGDFAKVAVVDVDSVDEEAIREAAIACPTAAITVEQIGDVLAWKLSASQQASRRVVKTFMFTDMVGSTSLTELLGDEEWEALVRWHDETLRGLFATHKGHEVLATGDGFFVDFDSPDDALPCAIAIQRTLSAHRRDHGFAPRVRIGIHLADATQVGGNYRGKGVHEAARIAAAAEGSEILASRDTVESTNYRTSRAREIDLKGISQPVEVVSVDWQ